MIIPLALPLSDRPAPVAANAPAADSETARAALSRALRDPSFWCLFFGFFVCGLHVSFLTVHLPGFVHSCGLPLYVGAGAISLIGLFNIGGSLLSGELTQRWKRRELLVCIYAGRAVVMTGFMLAEKTTTIGHGVLGADGHPVAVHRPADGGAVRAQLRHALARDHLRPGLPGPPDRRLHRRLPGRAWCSTAPAPTT